MKLGPDWVRVIKRVVATIAFLSSFQPAQAALHFSDLVNLDLSGTGIFNVPQLYQYDFILYTKFSQPISVEGTETYKRQIRTCAYKDRHCLMFDDSTPVDLTLGVVSFTDVTAARFDFNVPYHQEFLQISNFPYLKYAREYDYELSLSLHGQPNTSVLLTEVAAPGAPEPSTWATLTLGFGVVGIATRVRTRRGWLQATTRVEAH